MSSPITTDQLRNREIVASDLLTAATAQAPRLTIAAAPSAPLSVFGRKMFGHEG